MKITVVFFGELADISGTRKIEVADQNSVHELYQYLEEQYPNLKTQSFKIMVNGDLINHERELEDGDEITLMAPHIE